jgi:hypothetical protein
VREVDLTGRNEGPVTRSSRLWMAAALKDGVARRLRVRMRALA